MAWLNKSIGFFINVLFLVIVYWYVCEYNDNSCSCFASSKATEAWQIKDAKQTVFETKDRIEYRKHKVRPILTASIDSGLAKIVSYLGENPNKKLHIEASYLENEKIDTAVFNNLGMMRAEHLSKYLQAKGLDSKQIATASQLNTFEKVNENKLIGGVSMSIEMFRLVSIEREKQLLKQKLAVRFETGEAMILDSLALSIFADDVQKMFLQNKKVRLEIIGYADEIGNEMYNQDLSLKRATAVKQFLINKGLKTDKLIMKHKGEKELPFYSDSLNRCVILQLVIS